MVRIATLLAFIFCAGLVAAAVDVQVEIDSDMASVNQPISGKIIIHHEEGDPVDETSFRHKDAPLAVQLISEGRQSSVSIINGRRSESHKIVSCYWFEVSGQSSGSHKLAPISMKVGDQVIKSDPIAYQIHETRENNAFKLKRGIEGPSCIYPGQKIKAYYRVMLGTPVEETRIHLPLLNPPGFRKLGDVKVQQYRRGNSHVIEYSQELEAKEAGVFEIEESFIEGMAYQEDFFSRRVYKKPKLKAACSPITVEVASFPVENKPKSFEGAVGNFNLEAKLLSGNEVCVGDKIELELTIKGEGIDTLKLPNFAKQKSLSQSFRLSDLPPTGKGMGHQKTFVLDLRPLDASVKEIPAIEFSFFNPKTEEYETLKTSPIALSITALESPPILQAKEEPREESQIQMMPTPLEMKGPALIDISKVYSLERAVKLPRNIPIKPELFFLLLGFLGIQWIIKKRVIKGMDLKLSSLGLLKEAFKHSKELQKYHLLVEKALQTRLVERGHINELCPTEELRDEGIEGLVKNFLNEVQMQLFSGQKEFDFKKNQKLARKLYQQIGEAPL